MSDALYRTLALSLCIKDFIEQEFKRLNLTLNFELKVSTPGERMVRVSWEGWSGVDVLSRVCERIMAENDQYKGVTISLVKLRSVQVPTEGMVMHAR